MGDQTTSFGPFLYDSHRKLLLKKGVPVSLGQKALALLEALLRAEGRAVSKSELMDATWQTENVEESNLTVQIAALRKVLGHNSDGDEWIKTVQRFGYQLVQSRPQKGPAFLLGVPDRPLPSIDKLSIVVLPFANLSKSEKHDFFAEAITEDLIAALTRIRELFVISRTTSFSYKGQNISARRASQELGVAYVLEGSVQVAGNTVRVSAQLVYGATGQSIWSERFSGHLGDVFALQDDITRSIVIAMQIKLTYGDLARLWDGQTKSLQAWEKMAQGRDYFLCFDSVNVRRAQAVLNEALAMDAGYTGAMIQLGLCHWWQARYDTTADKEQSLVLCEQQAKRALSIDPQMGSAYMLLGGNALLRDQHDEAIALCEKAADLAPGDSWVLAYLGLVCIYGGKTERAIEVLKSALRLCPQPIGWYIESYAMAHIWNGDLDTAMAAAEEFRRLEPDDIDALVLLATVYGIHNHHEEAASTVAEIRAKYPSYCLQDTARTERYKEKDKLDKVLAALRRAGLPESVGG